MTTILSEEKPARASSARGFASMDTAQQREIARKGSRSVPAEKQSFSRDPKLAVEAGRKGGNSVPGDQRSFSGNRAPVAQAGRKGDNRSRKTKESSPHIEQESSVLNPSRTLRDEQPQSRRVKNRERRARTKAIAPQLEHCRRCRMQAIALG